MDIAPYLSFDGTCAEAFRFYEKALPAKIEMMMKYGESPMAEQTKPEHRDRVMHASLRVGERSILGADAPVQHASKPQGFCVALSVNQLSEAERVFGALGEGGQVQMPFQPTFWSAGFGMLIDRFGIPWMVNCTQPPAGSSNPA